MVDRPLCEERVPNAAPRSVVQPKFVSAAGMVANSRTTVQMTPEISDEELLEMAIKFDMEHPQ
jgi:hypothetical protein